MSNADGGAGRRARSSPWARLVDVGETSEQHEQFIAYRDLGPGRTIDAAYLKYREAHPAEARRGNVAATRRASGQFRRNSKTFDWKKRSDAWDDHLRARKDRVAADHAAGMETKRLEAIEQAYVLAEALLAKAKRMLALPIHSRRFKKDGKTIEWLPARWDYRTVAIMAKTAFELQAAGLQAASRPISEYSKPELEAIQAAREAHYLKLCGIDRESEGDVDEAGDAPDRPQFEH